MIAVEEPLTFHALFEPARTEEQMSLFSATAQAADSFPLSRLCDSVGSITQEELRRAEQDRRSRLFDRLTALASEVEDGTPDDPNLLALCQECRMRRIRLNHRSYSLMNTFLSQERSFFSPSRLSAEQKQLIAELTSLKPLLDNPPAGADLLDERNRAIVRNLRKMCSSPLYLAFRCSNSKLFIDFIHSLALCQYTETNVQPTFERLGRRLGGEWLSLAQRIRHIWDQLLTRGVNTSFCTTLTHFSLVGLIKNAVPFIAFKIAQFFSLHWLGRWAGNERSLVGNTPGVLYEERTMSRTVRTIALPAPTIATDGSPEFRAALQALENNQYSHPNAFVEWSYASLQNFAYAPERESAIALMKLGTEFPLSFHSITLPQGLPPTPQDDFSERDVEHHLSLIFQPQSTTLHQRGISPTDSGYYFPNPFLDRQREEIATIAKKAFSLISRRHDLSPTTLKTAYQRLFHLGIARLHEKDSQDQTSSRLHLKAIHTLRSTACASCIDRGGVMNAAYLHARDPNNGDLAAGAYFGRALLSQRRLPTEASYESLSALLSAAGRKLDQVIVG